MQANGSKRIVDNSVLVDWSCPSCSAQHDACEFSHTFDAYCNKCNKLFGWGSLLSQGDYLEARAFSSKYFIPLRNVMPGQPFKFASGVASNIHYLDETRCVYSEDNMGGRCYSAKRDCNQIVRITL